MVPVCRRRSYLPVGGLILASVLVTPALSQTQPHKQADQGASHATHDAVAEQNPPEVFRERLADDPVAYYTETLAWFTGALVIVSTVQIGFLIRADGTARLAAEAARDQAETSKAAYLSSRRPWLVVEVVAQELTFEWAYKPTFCFTLTNYGNSPAIIRRRSDGVLLLRKSPTVSEISSRVPRATSMAAIREGLSAAFISEFEKPPSAAEARDPFRCTIYAVGVIHYEGVDGLACETRFCWEYDPTRKQYYEVEYPRALNRRT